MSTPSLTPQWNLTNFFPSLSSAEYLDAIEDLKRLLEKTESDFKTWGMESGGRSSSDLAKAVHRLDELSEAARLIYAYASLHVSADSNDEESQAAVSLLQPQMTHLSKLGIKFTAWIEGFDIAGVVSEQPELAEFEFSLRKSQRSARHLMSPEEEALASDMSEFAGDAWGRLWGDFTSNLSVSVNGDSMSMSAARALAHDSSQDVRKAAYEAELDGWRASEITMAACMNSIKGEANLLAGKRGWSSQLEESLFSNNMDQASLDAMLSAAEDSFPSWRRYLQAKAKLLGYDGGLKFYDIFAPVGEDSPWSWEDGKKFVEDGFRSYSDKLADFAVRSFNEDWHDVSPRLGKRDGAFCSGVRGDESRMLHNFKDSFGSVSTLAHELGHAYHNVCLKDRKPSQKSTPMTLAETASIFCETIIKRRAIQETSGKQRLAILEASLQGACQVVVDITSRFKFESSVISARKERELSPRELRELMLDAQRATFGDGLNADCLHPYMWSVKPHYYSYRAFYNYPYMFGLLFALGLYNVYQETPDGFHERYDDLLSSTGMDMAANLTNRFGIDITDKAFWAGSLSVLQQDIDAFCHEVDQQ